MTDEMENRPELYMGESETQTTMKQIASMTKTAWAVLDLMVLNPGATQKDIAFKLGISRPYVSRIQNSQLFMDELARVRRRTLQDRAHAVGEAGLDRLEKIIKSNKSKDSDAINAAKLGLEATGMIGKAAAVQVNVNPENSSSGLEVTPDMVNAAREARRRKILDAEYTVVEDGEQKEVQG